MKRCFLITLILLFSISFLYGNAENYWQNEVSYTIDVSLDDSLHMLNGNQTATFKNNSPDDLDYLIVLLYPNAYKDTSTAFGRELIKNGYKKFFFSSDKDRGWIELDTISVDGNILSYEYFENNPDVAKIQLTKPLRPGQSIQVSFKFRVKIPARFSRFRHVENYYQMVYWYPRIAVYDKRGWGAYPYMEGSEFYGEFASYDVSITLPAYYLVASTGVLQTVSEKIWLDSLALEGNRLFGLTDKEKKREFKKLDKKSADSSKEFKTIRYCQDNVIDFAWFASKKYIPQKSEYILPQSGRKVEIWTFCEPSGYKSWQNSTQHLLNGLKYYSQWYGEYPYSHVTAVEGSFAFQGGMEYPMISVNSSIGEKHLMEDVLIHETGHNWFYGIIASDERKHPWMDEGFNSFSTGRTLKELHPVDEVVFAPEIISGLTPNLTQPNAELNIMTSFQRKDLNMPNNLPDYEYPDPMQANFGIFNKSALGIKYLKSYMGEEKFNVMMQEYYETWKFKHPMPDDFIQLAEKYTGENLDWFFNDFMGSDKLVDYSLENIDIEQAGNSYTLSFKVVNQGQINIPYHIEIYKNGQVLQSIWQKTDKLEHSFQFTLLDKPDKIIIDPELTTFDRNTHDNIWPKSVVFQPLFDLEDPHKYQLFYNLLPYYNAADGFTLSGNIFRYNIAPQRHNFLVSGGYGFKSENPIFRVIYDDHIDAHKGKVRYGYRFTASDNYGHRQYSARIDYKYMYPFNDYDYSQKVTFAVDYLDFYTPEFYDASTWSTGEFTDFRLKYNFRKKWYLDKLVAAIVLTKGIQTQNSYYDYSKIDLSAVYRRQLNLETFIYLSVFGGKFFQNDYAPLQQYFCGNGGLDPYFEDIFMFDRSNTTFLSPSQHLIKINGPLLRGYSYLSGNDYAVTSNLEFEKGSWGIFSDAGSLVNEGSKFDAKFSGGIFVTMGIFRVDVPLYISDTMGYKGNWIDMHNYDERLFLSINIPDFKIGL